MKPNREEQLTIDNLIYQGFEKIEFEPNSNVPPDILVNNKIAIEVRRLNQNQVIDQKYKGLEQAQFSVNGILKKVMQCVSEENYDVSAFVSFYFKRPIPTNKEIKRYVTKILENHKSFIEEEREYKFNDNFKIKVFPSEIKLDQQYNYGISRDGDSGGFIVSLIYDNLKLIVSEKEVKINKYRDNYHEWWLAVVDTIGYELSDLDIEQFHNLPKIENQFDRLLLVSAIDYKSFRFLYE